MAFISLDSPSCEVPCLILLSVVYRDVPRHAKGLYRLKHDEALERGLTYLSRCNSDWFCHKHPPLPPRSIQVWRSLPPCLLMLLRALDGHVHQPPAGNGDAPLQPPPLLAAGRAPPLPVEPHFAQPVPHALLVVPDRSLPTGDLAAGGNVRSRRPVAVGAWQGPLCEGF
jgi:hypothetical protein